jgi:hypothetical protein
MALEQIPGNLDLKIVKGDDLILQFNVPFSVSGYTFITNVYDSSGTTYSILTSATVQSSILSIVETTFYASTTSKFTPISENTSHAINITNSSHWKMVYVDNNNYTRTFISGYIEAVEIVQ